MGAVVVADGLTGMEPVVVLNPVELRVLTAEVTEDQNLGSDVEIESNV